MQNKKNNKPYFIVLKPVYEIRRFVNIKCQTSSPTIILSCFQMLLLRDWYRYFTRWCSDTLEVR